MRVAFIVHLQRTNDDGTPTDIGASQGLDHLLETTCQGFVVQCQQTGIKRNRSGAETSSTESSSSAEDVGLLLRQLSYKGNWVIHDLLLDRLLSSAQSVQILAFPLFLLPLLATLITGLQSSPNHISHYEHFFREVLAHYRTRYIQPKPKDSDWAHSPQGCGARYCHDCRKLDKFLLDPTQQVERFPVNNGARAHLHQQLDGTGISHVTDGSETLVVSKKQNAMHRAFTEWQARVAEAETAFQAMDQDVLKELLGEQFTEITDFHNVENTHRASRAVRSTRESRIRGTTTIIDLKEED